MTEATIPQPTPVGASRWTLIKEMFAEMDRLRAQLKQDRVEIDRLTPIIQTNIQETRTILDRIAAS